MSRHESHRRSGLNRWSRIEDRDASGFTLIEVVLALAILALAASVLYASFSTTSTNVDVAEALREDTDLARTILMRLSHDIVNAYCNSGVQETFFYAKKEEVQTPDGPKRMDSLYLTTMTNTRRPGTEETDLWEVGYFFKEKPDGSGYVLMRREKREIRKDSPPLEGGEEYPVTDKIDGLELSSYYGSKWRDEVGGPDKCIRPEAVRVTLSLYGGKIYTTAVFR